MRMNLAGLRTEMTGPRVSGKEDTRRASEGASDGFKGLGKWYSGKCCQSLRALP